MGRGAKGDGNGLSLEVPDRLHLRIHGDHDAGAVVYEPSHNGPLGPLGQQMGRGLVRREDHIDPAGKGALIEGASVAESYELALKPVDFEEVGSLEDRRELALRGP